MFLRAAVWQCRGFVVLAKRGGAPKCANILAGGLYSGRWACLDFLDYSRLYFAPLGRVPLVFESDKGFALAAPFFFLSKGSNGCNEFVPSVVSG